MNKEEFKETFISLITDHPDADIRVVVDEEVVTGEYSSYLADVYDLYFSRIVFYNDMFYDDEESVFEEFCYTLWGEEEFDENTAREMFHKEFDDKWEDVIIIHASV